MDMDPLTRREADKIEQVLRDLVDDLELVSLLPSDWGMWLRDDVTTLAEKYTRGGGGGDNGSRSGSSSSSGGGKDAYVLQHARLDAIDDVAERERVARACCFVRCAARYGDPADVVHNEAVLQVGEFSEVERELLDKATTVGHLDKDDVDFHHLSLRALLDTLREGGYAAYMLDYLRRCYPPVQTAHSRHRRHDRHRRGGSDDDDDGDDSRSSSSSNNSRGSHADGVSSDRDEDAMSCSDDDVDSNSSSRDDSTGDVHDDTQPPSLPHRRPSTRLHSPHERYDGKAALQRGAPLLHEGAYNMTHVMRVLAHLIALRNRYTVNEDIHRYKVLHEAVNKEQSATADVQALNRAYEEAKAARRSAVAALDDEVAQLTRTLSAEQAAAEAELSALLARSRQAQAEQRAVYAQQLDEHRRAGEQLQSRLHRLQAQHLDEVNKLRSLRAKKEAAVSGAIAEYDTQMQTLQATIDKLAADAEEDTRQSVVLEEQLATLYRERDEYDLEQHVAERRHEHLQAIRLQQTQHVRVIQAYYRAYLTRVTLAREANNGKKKKKTKTRGKRGTKSAT